MNKMFLLLFSVLLITGFEGVSQSKKTKNLLKEIEGQWSLDDNNNLTYIRLVNAEELSKEEIFSRALSYFVYNYGSGKSVIQTQDKELGRIIGKGNYKNVHVGMSLITTYIDCFHIARVDVKDGRARIILTLTEYEKKITGGNTPPTYSTSKAILEYPINPKGTQKTVMGKAFYKSHKHAIATMDALEKAIIEGNTSSSIEKDDW